MTMRRVRYPKVLALGAAIGLAAGTAACAGTAGTAGQAASQSSLSIALGADPQGLDPQLYQDQETLDVDSNIFEPLIFTNATSGALEPGLATSWKQVNDTTLQVTLRDGVKFSDGEPFDADSVVFSIDRITNKSFHTLQTQNLGTIDGAKKVTNNVVDILSSQPDATMPQSLSLIMMVPKQYISAHGNAYFNAHPVGTGPYVFQSWIRGSRLTLTANPHYWGGQPQVKTVNFLTIPNSNTQLNALEDGTVNIAVSLSAQQAAQAPRKILMASPNHAMLVLNQRSGPFANLDVRLAANYAINRAELAKVVYDGAASPTTCQPIGPQTAGYDPSLTEYPYDPEKAKQLLAASGDPHPSINFIGLSGQWTADLASEEAIVGYLQAVGFKVNFEDLPVTSYIKAAIPNNNSPSVTSRPDAYFVEVGDTLGDADQKLQALYARNAPDGSLNDPTLFSLVNEESTTMNRSQRTKLQQEVLARACQQAEFVYLVVTDDVYGVSSDIQWQPRFDEVILAKTVTFK